ncbi:MAG: hypothetical protein IT424_03270 [Pirellulales bacterium]|nr:hypothetical protein [Pirellulales bacterium]
MSRFGRPYCRSAAALLAVASAVALAGGASAQQYDQIKPRIDIKQFNAASGKVAVILRDATTLDAASTKELDDFFVGYLYSSMTSTDPVELGLLQEKRGQLFTRYLNNARSQAARDYVTDVTLKAMSALSKGNYHPAVRYNAVLILGQLEGEPGKPLAGATEALLAVLQNDKFKDSKGREIEVPTAVKVGALVGLQRHLSRGVDAKYAEPITKAALAVATREKAPEDVSATVYGWVRRQAAQVLAQQFAQGLTPEVNQAFVQIIGSDANDLDDRCGVAELLTPPMYEGKNLDTQAMAQALGKLAQDVLAVESKEADEYLDEVTASGGIMPGGGFGGGYGRGYEGGGGYGRGLEGMSFDPAADLGPKYEKRRMMDRAKAIVAAAQAVSTGSPEELQGRLRQLAAAISAVIDTAATATDAAIADAVFKLSTDVTQMVSSWAPAQGPAGDAGDEGFGPPAETPPAAAAQPAAAG